MLVETTCCKITNEGQIMVWTLGGPHDPLPYENNLYHVIPTSEANIIHENPYFIHPRQPLGKYEICFLNPNGELNLFSLSVESWVKLECVVSAQRGVQTPLQTTILFFFVCVFFGMKHCNKETCKRGGGQRTQRPT